MNTLKATFLLALLLVLLVPVLGYSMQVVEFEQGHEVVGKLLLTVLIALIAFRQRWTEGI